jgi:hypothetical protein
MPVRTGMGFAGKGVTLKKYRLIIGLVVLPILVLFACREEEKIDQGRVIAFDKTKRTLTLIRDKNNDPQFPDYSQLPPITYDLPEDFLGNKEGLKAGLRMKLKTENNQIIIYDPITQNFKTIAYTLIDKKEGIFLENSLVFDLDNRKSKKFPIIDRERKMITIYSRRQGILTTFTLPDKYFDLPDYTWNAGDEVRIYFKERRALRLINITKLGFVKD